MFDSQLLVVDVGAAPGGWSAYLANLPQVGDIHLSVHCFPLLVVDVVAAPGGWSTHLDSLPKVCVSISTVLPTAGRICDQKIFLLIATTYKKMSNSC